MTNDEIRNIINNHQHWLNKDCEGWQGMRANFAEADLSGSDLRKVNLSKADLSKADLSKADLRKVNLSKADLSGSDLRGANLRNACLNGSDLRNACLNGSDLRNACLSGSDLRGADLRYASLDGADLRYASLDEANLHNISLQTANAPLANYRKGIMLRDSIIGYKKCKDSVIVTLEIPKGAIVFSINGCKCRTNKAKVIAIDGADRAFSNYNHMSYYVGDEFTIYDFNLEYNVECAEGIHFFMTREEAEQY